MNQNDQKPTVSDHRQEPGINAQIALYERLLVEKDGLLAEKESRTAELSSRAFVTRP